MVNMTPEEKDLINQIRSKEEVTAKDKENAIKRLGECLEETFILDLLPSAQLKSELHAISEEKSVPPSIFLCLGNLGGHFVSFATCYAGSISNWARSRQVPQATFPCTFRSYRHLFGALFRCRHPKAPNAYHPRAAPARPPKQP